MFRFWSPVRLTRSPMRRLVSLILGGGLAVLQCGVLWSQTSAAGTEATTVATNAPTGVAYDASGNLYVALKNDHSVVRIDTKGLITVVAGTGDQGFAGDGGPATSALLDSPEGLALDSSGNLYIADTHNHRIREVVNGVINTIAGTGVAGFSGDGGSATSAQLAHPTALNVDAAGNIYLADSDNHRIRKISAGTMTTVAGDGEQTFSGDGGPATSAGLDTPAGVTADPTTAGRFYISDTHNQRIRVVDATGTISTLAGTGTKGFAGNGSPAATAVLARPRGLAAGSSGILYIADSDNNLIRTIQATNISTLAGDGEQGFAGDTAAASAAVLDTPTAVAVFPDGPVALSDTHNQRTRSLASNVINTVAGVAPARTEGIVLSGPVATVYGTGTLLATFSNGMNIASGAATLLDSGASIGSQTFAGNQASFDLSQVHAGVHVLAVIYRGDAQNAPTASGVFLLTVGQAQQTLNFQQPPTPVVYGTGVTIPLTASASSGLPVTYTVTGPATVSGSTLTLTGPGEVVVTAQAGDQDYESVSVSRTIEVTPLTLTAISPSSAFLGDQAKLLTVSGTGFVQNSVRSDKRNTVADDLHQQHDAHDHNPGLRVHDGSGPDGQCAGSHAAANLGRASVCGAAAAGECDGDGTVDDGPWNPAQRGADACRTVPRSGGRDLHLDVHAGSERRGRPGGGVPERREDADAESPSGSDLCPGCADPGWYGDGNDPGGRHPEREWCQCDADGSPAHGDRDSAHCSDADPGWPEPERNGADRHDPRVLRHARDDAGRLPLHAGARCVAQHAGRDGGCHRGLRSVVWPGSVEYLWLRLQLHAALHPDRGREHDPAGHGDVEQPCRKLSCGHCPVRYREARRQPQTGQDEAAGPAGLGCHSTAHGGATA